MPYIIGSKVHIHFHILTSLNRNEFYVVLQFSQQDFSAFLMVHNGTVNGILSLIKYQNIKKKSFSYHRLQEHILFPPKPDKSYSKNKAKVK